MNAVTKTPPVTFAEAFCKLQAQIKPAIKDSVNPAFRSKYADLGAVWDAVKEPLTENGFSIIQSPNFDEHDMWLETTILHISGEKMTGRYPLRPTKNDPQGFGSALTYSRRYSISAMLGVVADIDDDGNAASAPAKNMQIPANTGAAAALVPTQDEDIDRGVKHWVEQQKEVIAECKTLPELNEWLDTNGGDLLKPSLSSNLDRLMKKNRPAFTDLKNFYLDRMNKI